MEVAVLFALLVLVVAVIVGIQASKEDPRNSASGRWGIKTGKFVSGNWGGEKWGEKDSK